MNLIKWQPFHWLSPRRRTSPWDLYDLFEPTLGSTRTFQPASDVYEENGTIRLKAEMPGLSDKDVSVEVKDNHLVIAGEKKEEHSEEKNGPF